MRHNEASFIGIISNDKIIKKKGDYSYYSFNILTKRRVYGYKDTENLFRTDYIQIFFKAENDSDMVKELEACKKNTAVLINGYIVTRNGVKKRVACDKCGTTIDYEGQALYVNPEAIIKIRDFDTFEEAESFIESVRNVSNKVTFLGNVCNNPKKIVTKGRWASDLDNDYIYDKNKKHKFVNNNETITYYEVATERKKMITTEDSNIRSDYIWVNSRGEQAVEDFQRLKAGTSIFLDGYLQRRSVLRTSICPDCGEEIKWIDKTAEIVPYAIEYIKDFKTDEEIQEEMRKKTLEQNKAQDE